MAASTSALTMRPLGPEPLIAVMSSPALPAMRRASGEAKTFWPSLTGTGPALPPSWAALAAGAALAGDAAGMSAGPSLGWGFSPPPAPSARPPPSEGEVEAPPPLAASATFSPSPARIAITELTLTPSVPAGTTIFAIVPSSTASTSMVALSVSISAITSPEETVSPSLTSHLARLPSSIVGDSAGMVMLIGMVPSLRPCKSRL